MNSTCVYCSKPTFAVVSGEEGYPVCLTHFLADLGAAETCIHCFFDEEGAHSLPYKSRLVKG